MTKEAEVKVSHYVHSGKFRDIYERYHLSNWPVGNERLEDRPANNKLAMAKVYLLFLVQKSYKPVKNPISNPNDFEVPKISIYTNSANIMS